jgi:hypothetical protein
MYANELPEFVKLCIDGMHVFNRNNKTMAVYIMAKPRSETLDHLFSLLKEALSTESFCQAIIYSDDSCISGKNGDSFGYNVDISSNDSSQDVPAFLAAYLSMGGFHEARAEGLIDQCLLPILLCNPESRDEMVKIKFDGPFEGSGTVLTTILNHYASLMIYLAFFHLWTEGELGVEDCIRQGASLVGHVVTVEPWGHSGVDINKAQFLKRSPDGATMRSCINLGCLLRSMGTLDDELTPTQLCVSNPEFVAMTMNQRMMRFFSSVMEGWKNEPSNSILNALRERFNSDHSVVEVVEKLKHDSLKYVLPESVDYSSTFSDVGIIARYGLSSDEISDAVELIRNIQLGQVVSCTAFSKIYHVDYGLPLPDGLVV